MDIRARLLRKCWKRLRKHNPGDIHGGRPTKKAAGGGGWRGASFTGARVLVTMKQMGLTVAADPLMCLSYLGVKGGLVVLAADDPGPISSQTEQDTRHFLPNSPTCPCSIRPRPRGVPDGAGSIRPLRAVGSAGDPASDNAHLPRVRFDRSGTAQGKNMNIRVLKRIRAGSFSQPVPEKPRGTERKQKEIGKEFSHSATNDTEGTAASALWRLARPIPMRRKR